MKESTRHKVLSFFTEQQRRIMNNKSTMCTSLKQSVILAGGPDLLKQHLPQAPQGRFKGIMVGVGRT